MEKASSQRLSGGQTALGVTLLVLLVILAGAFVWAIGGVFTSASPTVAAAIIAGTATVLVSVVSLIYSKQWERRSEIEQEHRKQKTPAYTEFIAFLFKMFRTAATNPLPPDELKATMDSFIQELIIWGSSDVMRQYKIFQKESLKLGQMNQQTTGSEEQRPEVAAQMLISMVAFENVLYAIRADLGHDTKGMKQGELLALFVTDIGNYFNLGQ